MGAIAKRLVRLIVGLFLYAIGIVLTLKAHIGYSPWDVFHVGLSQVVGMSIGLASILTGLAIVITAAFLGERVGLGTILNMVLIGLFLDLILALDVIPQAASPVLGLAMMVAGLLVISLASFFYIGSGFGAGPRDSLMVAITRKTRIPIGLARAGIELFAVFVGWRMGGLVGFGTLFFALTIGLGMQLTFKLLRFDPASIEHESLMATWNNVRASMR
ncbi:MAG: hypothetical protein RBT62_07230 [Spirochaetia bacterium]|jgi:uncharacterized membrane protein YczE|nr:hypothetical protein [Spirochaetia bacterium]